MTSSPRIFRFGRVAFLWAAVLQSAAANDTYKFDQTNSSIGFRVHQFLGATSGKFTQFTGSIDLDRAHPQRSSVSARIQVSSIDTRIKKRDDHLRSEEFFNVAKYPEITFKSRSAKQTGPQSGDIVGDFTMHGATRQITLHVKLATPFSQEGSPQRTRWEVNTEPIKRRDFDLLFGKTAETVSGISQDVAIKIEIEAMRAP
ncbi:MAG: YceI family protein [Verrucomicrobiota bacterium]